MSDHPERILLINLPDFVDEWVLKSTAPCGDLIDRTEKNPSDPSKMVIFTKGKENALKIASTLNNYSLFGSVIQAWCAFTTPLAEASKAVTNSSTSNGIQRKIEKKSKEKTPSGHSNKNPERQQEADTKPANMAEDETGHLHRDRKRRSSAVVGSTETLEHSRRDEPAGSPFKTPGQKSSERKGRSRSRDSWPLSEQAKDASSGKSRRCRFCHRSGHDTWMCSEKAEYYKVVRTTKEIKGKGCLELESCIVKVEKLYAGPVIEYIEGRHLQKGEMNREQIRIMFAWLTNYIVCHDCGAAGHLKAEGLCKYLPLDRPVTKEEIDQFRKPFGRRMRGIRDRVSLGELQRLACSGNNQFRRWMPAQDHGPLEFTGKRMGNPQKGTSAESTDKKEGLKPREGFGPILFAPDGKRIKIEPPDGYDQVSDDDDLDDVVFVREISPKRPAGHRDPSGMTHDTSNSIKNTLEDSKSSNFVSIE